MLSKLNDFEFFNDSRRVTFVAVAAAAAAAAALNYAVRSLRVSISLPPGPIGLPLLGRLPWMRVGHIEESLEEMRQKYGDIYSYRAGQRLMIVVSSYEMLNEMLRLEIFSGRQAPPFRKRLTEGCGIAFAEGDNWSRQRRLCLRILRNFGLGRSESASLIEVEVEEALKSIERRPTGRDTVEMFRVVSNSVVAGLVFGRRYANEDERYDKFVTDMRDIANLGVSTALGFLFPTFSNLLERVPAVKMYLRAFRSLRRFVEEEIRVRESQLEDSDAECLVDAYIHERRKAEADGDFESYRPLNLTVAAMEMFVAGTETTASSIQWLLLYVAVNPSVQSRVHQELDDRIGRDRRPRQGDRQSLHYTQAVIDESMRLSSLDFNGLPHRALRDANFRGFLVPADAVVVPFTFGLHRDATIWRRPNEFCPEHFLTPEGQYLPSKYLVPFLIGKRSCPGESLAKLEIFLAFAAVMQKYRVTLQEKYKLRVEQLLRGTSGTLRKAGHHLLDFSPR